MAAPADDDFISVLRSEEHLRAGTVRTPVQRAVLRKVIVSDERTITVTVRREEFRLDYEPLESTRDNSDAPLEGSVGPVSSIEVVLHEERIEIIRTVVPIERVRVAITRVVEQQVISGTVRLERVDVEGVDESDGDVPGRHRR